MVLGPEGLPHGGVLDQGLVDRGAKGGQKADQGDVPALSHSKGKDFAHQLDWDRSVKLKGSSIGWNETGERR